MVLKGAFDIDEKKRSILPRDIKFYDSLDVLLNSNEVDVILVSTPNLTHFEIGYKVLSANYPLILEKPVSHSFNDLTKLKGLSSDKQIFFSVALHATQAYEVKWWLENCRNQNYEIGELTGFSCGFYDPYIIDGNVIEKAKGFGGSWFDSGINALSVIGLFVPPQNIEIYDSKMTSINTINCEQVQGHSLFSFETESGRVGRGVINTNWTLGLNRKVTRLFYDLNRIEVILNHSKESIIIKKNGKKMLEREFSDGNNRLENHYVGVFNDLASRYHSRSSNIDYANEIHKLLFMASEFNDEK